MNEETDMTYGAQMESDSEQEVPDVDTPVKQCHSNTAVDCKKVNACGHMQKTGQYSREQADSSSGGQNGSKGGTILQKRLEKILFEHLPEIPGVFMEFGTTADKTKLQVHVHSGTIDKADKFLRQHLGSMENVEIMDKRGMNKFATGQFRPTEYKDKVSRGSMSVSLSPERYRKVVQSGSLGDGQTFGTITAFMKDKTSNDYYGLTSAHVLFETPRYDLEWPQQPYSRSIFSRLDLDGIRSMFPEIAEEFYAGMEYTNDGDDTKKFIDIGIFRIDPTRIDGGLIQLDFDSSHGPPSVYEDHIDNLKDREVIKIGAATGITTGNIKDLERAVIVELPNKKEIQLTGMMVVTPIDKEEFGTSGDSGSPVFLLNSETNIMVGNICAGSYDNSSGKSLEMYCLPMCRLLQYIHDKQGLRLEFPRKQGSTAESNEEKRFQNWRLTYDRTSRGCTRGRQSSSSNTTTSTSSKSENSMLSLLLLDIRGRLKMLHRRVWNTFEGKHFLQKE